MTPPPPFQLILTSQELRDFTESLEKSWQDSTEEDLFITVDTEFIRENTYYPHPCLCQIGGPHQVALIDMLIPEIDLAPLKDLFQNPRIPKVFHAARQDLEIFYQLFGQLPTPLFDTQIAAMVCHYGPSISYEKLVTQITGHSLDKSAQQTDWTHRPLSPHQLAYAAGDVSYLRSVYKFLRQKLKKLDRESWILEETQALTNPNLYAFQPETSWKRLKLRTSSPSFLCLVQEIASWREKRARDLNLSRNRILRDEVLTDLALACNRTSCLKKIHVRGLEKNFLSASLLEGLQQAIEKGWDRARNSQENSAPSSEKGVPLPMDTLPVLDLLTLLLKVVCQKAGIVPRLVASSEDLIQLSQKEYPSDLLLLQGWRYALFGKKALDLKEGSLALTLDGKDIKFISLPPASPSATDQKKKLPPHKPEPPAKKDGANSEVAPHPPQSAALFLKE